MCGEKSAVLQPETYGSFPIVITTCAFQYIPHDGVTGERAAQIGDSLPANQSRIMGHLRVAVMPSVTVSLCAHEHRDEFYSFLPYQWGYFISSCIIDRWGDEAYLAKIKSNGSARSSLGITGQKFGDIAEDFARSLAESQVCLPVNKTTCSIAQRRCI